MAVKPTDAGASETVDEGPTSASNTSPVGGQSFSTFQWILAWSVLGVVLLLLARTRIGYLLIYYALALSILFLIVTQYQWFAQALAPFQALGAGLTAKGNNTASTASTAGSASDTTTS